MNDLVPSKRSIGASLVAQMVKRLPAMRETGVWSLGWEDLLEKEMTTHYSILAWKIPWTKEPGRLQSMGSQRVRHDWATSLHFTSLQEVYCRQLPSCCILTWWGNLSLFLSSLLGGHLSHPEGSTLKTLFIYSPHSCPNTITLGIRASKMIFTVRKHSVYSEG